MAALTANNTAASAIASATAGTMAEPVKRSSKSLISFIQERLTNAPVESIAVALIGPWLMGTVAKGAFNLLTESHENNPKLNAVARKYSSDPTNAGENADGKSGQTIKYRGKTFLQVDSKEKVDLSWTGALPYWLPVWLIGMEGVMMLRFGAKYFEKRGYSPAQRHAVQSYVFFAVLPLVDLLSGDDWANPTKEQQKDRRLAYRFRLPLYFWTVFEYIMTIGTFRTVLDFKNGLSKRSRFALVMQLGLFNGAFGINVSHELLHKNNKFEKMLAWALLTNVNYSTF
jgi:hypothetical protein